MRPLSKRRAVAGTCTRRGKSEDLAVPSQCKNLHSVQPLALAKHRLRQCEPAAAEALLAIETGRLPDDIGAWALRGIAWQMLGDSRFDWLNGQPGLVDVDALPLSSDQVSAIADRLRRRVLEEVLV